MGDSYELRITSPTGNDWFQWIVLVTEFYNELGAEFGLQNHKGLIKWELIISKWYWFTAMVNKITYWYKPIYHRY